MDEMRGLLASEVAQRRLDRLASHFCEANLAKEEKVSREVCAKPFQRSVNPTILANLMAGIPSDAILY